MARTPKKAAEKTASTKKPAAKKPAAKAKKAAPAAKKRAPATKAAPAKKAAPAAKRQTAAKKPAASAKAVSGYGSGGVETVISVEEVTRQAAAMADHITVERANVFKARPKLKVPIFV